MATSSASGIARFRVILWTLVVLAALVATALFFFKPPATPIGVTGAPFTLTSTKGGSFTQADLKGVPSLVFFGYTHCPNVCPTTMADIANWRQKLGLGEDKLRTIFVTVDPDRDTTQVLSQYITAFDPDATGLVGDAAQTAAVKASFGVISEKGPVDKDGNYDVNHTATVFLIGKNGEFEGTLDYQESDDSAEAKIKRLIGA